MCLDIAKYPLMVEVEDQCKLRGEVTVFWEDVYGWMSIPVCIGMYFLVWSCVWEIRDQSLEWLSSLGTICFEQPPLAWNFARCARALVGQ